MINIKKFDVGFGDFLSVRLFDSFCYDTSHLIIDCGSNIANSSVGKRYIRKELTSDTDVLLTHFHTDHYNILFDNCDLPFRRLLIRKPDCSADGIIDFIAIACMKIVCCIPDEELLSSSAWFIANITTNLKNLNNTEFLAFEDDDEILHYGSYKVKAIKVNRTSYEDDLNKMLFQIGAYKALIIKIAKTLSQLYVDFCNRVEREYNSFDVQKKLLYLRERLLGRQNIGVKKKIDELYDKIVNESSAVVGIWDKNKLEALFLGDIGLNAQSQMSVSYKPTLLKLSHHGTYQYNSTSILQQFNPSYKLITYGYGKCKKENNLLSDLVASSYVGERDKKYVEVTI